MATTAPRRLLLLGGQLQLSLLAETQEEAPERVAGTPGVEDVSAFEALYGTTLPKRARPEASAALEATPGKRGGGEDGVFGATPSHAMPPLAKLFGHFIAKMLPAKAEAPSSVPAAGPDVSEAQGSQAQGEGTKAVAQETQKAMRRGEKRMLKHIEPPEKVYAAFGDFFKGVQKKGSGKSPRASPAASPKAARKKAKQ